MIVGLCTVPGCIHTASKMAQGSNGSMCPKSFKIIFSGQYFMEKKKPSASVLFCELTIR